MTGTKYRLWHILLWAALGCFLVLAIGVATLLAAEWAGREHFSISNSSDLVTFSGMVINFFGVLVTALTMVSAVVTIAVSMQVRSTRMEFDKLYENTVREISDLRVVVERRLAALDASAQSRTRGAHDRLNDLIAKLAHVEKAIERVDQLGLKAPQEIVDKVENTLLKSLFATYEPADRLRASIITQVEKELFEKMIEVTVKRSETPPS